MVKKYNEAQKEKAEKNIPDEVFTVYWLFKEEGLPKPEALANELHDTFQEYKYFNDDANHRRKIKQKMTQLLAKRMKGVMKPAEIIALTNKILDDLKESAE